MTRLPGSPFLIITMYCVFTTLSLNKQVAIVSLGGHMLGDALISQWQTIIVLRQLSHHHLVTTVNQTRDVLNTALGEEIANTLGQCTS